MRKTVNLKVYKKITVLIIFINLIDKNKFK